MRIDSSGKVGIGTDSPQSIFHTRTSESTSNHNAGGGFSLTSSSTAGSRASVLFLDPDGGNFATTSDGAYAYFEKKGAGGDLNIINQDNANTKFYTSGLQRMAIDSAGNVGINNSSPSSYDSNARNLVVGSGSGDEGITIASGAGSGGRLYFADGTSGNAVADGYIFVNHASQFMSFGVDASEKLRITNAGIVGINTTSPDSNSKLDVNGNLYATRLYVDAGGNGSDPMIRVSTDTNTGIFFPANDNLAITTGGSERLRLEANGTLALGNGDNRRPFAVASNLGYESTYKTTIIGSTSTSYNTNATGATSICFNYNPSGNGSGSFSGNGSEIWFRRGQVFKTPNAADNSYFTQFSMTDGVTSGDFNDTSDRNLKENITSITNGYDVIKNLNPVTFDWKDANKGNGLGGFIAQEVETVLPCDVLGEDYAEGDRGEPLTDGKSINTTSIVAHLTKAVQEQQELIEDLQTQINKLKGE